MKVFFDTNVWLAAFLSHGTCHELVEHCLGAHHLYFSKGVRDEVEEKLTEKFRFPDKQAREIIAFIEKNSEMVKQPIEVPKACRDSDDDAVLAAAVACAADCIVTGDEDLLVLKEFQGIRIIRPNRFWEYEKIASPDK